MGGRSPYLWWPIHSQLNLTGNILIDKPTGIFMVILNPVKFMRDVYHHNTTNTEAFKTLEILELRWRMVRKEGGSYL